MRRAHRARKGRRPERSSKRLPRTGRRCCCWRRPRQSCRFPRDRGRKGAGTRHPRPTNRPLQHRADSWPWQGRQERWKPCRKGRRGRRWVRWRRTQGCRCLGRRRCRPTRWKETRRCPGGSWRRGHSCRSSQGGRGTGRRRRPAAGRGRWQCRGEGS